MKVQQFLHQTDTPQGFPGITAGLGKIGRMPQNNPESKKSGGRPPQVLERKTGNRKPNLQQLGAHQAQVELVRPKPIMNALMSYRRVSRYLPLPPLKNSHTVPQGGKSSSLDHFESAEQKSQCLVFKLLNVIQLSQIHSHQ